MSNLTEISEKLGVVFKKLASHDFSLQSHGPYKIIFASAFSCWNEVAVNILNMLFYNLVLYILELSIYTGEYTIV